MEPRSGSVWNDLYTATLTIMLFFQGSFHFLCFHKMTCRPGSKLLCFFYLAIIGKYVMQIFLFKMLFSYIKPKSWTHLQFKHLYCICEDFDIGLSFDVFLQLSQNIKGQGPCFYFYAFVTTWYFDCKCFPISWLGVLKNYFLHTMHFCFLTE